MSSEWHIVSSERQPMSKYIESYGTNSKVFWLETAFFSLFIAQKFLSAELKVCVI